MKYIFVLLMCFLSSLSLYGQLRSEVSAIDRELIVWLTPETDVKAFISNLNKRQDLSTFRWIKTLGHRSNIHLFQFDSEKADRQTIIHQLRSAKEVLQVQFNAEVNYRITPNDLNYAEQWDMDRIAMPEAWELSTGGLTVNGDTIVIAILDSGFDITHADLRDNVWYNHAEIPGDNIDNDNNGYIDDYVGWNFRADTSTHGLNTHGHSVAGIIGARGNNNIGVTGVNWNIKLMLLDTKTISSIIAAYEYVIDKRELYNTSGGAEGAFVVATNASWGIENQFCDEQPIIRDLYDQMGHLGILTAAGTANTNYNVDLYGDFPTTCPSDYLLTVTNTLMNDEKSQNSGFGTTSVDMGAPGDDSYTIRLNDDYGVFGSNSAATPHLTGAIGLLYSLLCPEMATDALIHPAEVARVVKNVLLSGVDPVTALVPFTKTGGRLNVAKSAFQLLESCSISTGDLKIISMKPNPASEMLFVEYQSPDFKEYTFWVHNALGQLILKETVTPNLFNEKIYHLDVSQLSPGLFTVSILGKENRVSGKFLVVR